MNSLIPEDATSSVKLSQVLELYSNINIYKIVLKKKTNLLDLELYTKIWIILNTASLQIAKTYGAVDYLFNGDEDITLESSKSTDRDAVERVGILSRHGISLGPVPQVDSIAAIGLRHLTPRTVSNNIELQMTEELPHECADKAKKTFRQLQQMMKHVWWSKKYYISWR